MKLFEKNDLDKKKEWKNVLFQCNDLENLKVITISISEKSLNFVTLNFKKQCTQI
jgi:hypothetical protein